MPLDNVDLQIEADPGSLKGISIRIDGVDDGLAEILKRRLAAKLPSLTAASARAEDLSRISGKEETQSLIRVGIGGVSSSPGRRRELENAVRASVAVDLDRAAAADACICASDVPGYSIGFGNKKIPWFTDGVWTPPPSGEAFWVF